jgi:hypothetical protein
MEFLAILMSGLLAGLSPFSLILEEIGGRRINERLQAAESFEVRVDNLPSHQFLLGGKIDRVQLASRGVELIPGLRLAALELETDAVNLDVAQLRSGQPGPGVLREPLQTGLRFVLTEADINEALRSPRARTLIQPVVNRVLNAPGSTSPDNFRLETAHLEFLGDNRFQFVSELSRVDAATGETEQSSFRLTFTLGLASGSQFQWQDLEGDLDGRPLPPPLLDGVAQAISQRFNLRIFQDRGLLARFLQLEADDQELKGAMFIRFTPQNLES